MNYLFIIIFVVTFGAIIYYLSKRTYKNLSYKIKINYSIYLIIYIILALTLIMGFVKGLLPINDSFKNILSIINAYVMGIFLYLLFFCIFFDIFIMFYYIFVKKKLSDRFRFFSYIFILIFVFFINIYGYLNAKDIKNVSYNIVNKKNISVSDINIVMISDIHLGAVNSIENLSNAIYKINKLNPDILFIVGDIFDNNYYSVKNIDKVSGLFKSIKVKYGIYASLGNHDSGKTIDEMLNFLNESNINVLNDEYVIIDERLVVLGRLDATPIERYNKLIRNDLKSITKDIDFNLPVVVLDHNPLYLSEYDNKFDLILSGHTHKGQIFPGNIITNIMYVNDYGIYKKDINSPNSIVTSGVGTWGMPLRIGTDNEIVSIKIKDK